MATKQGRYEGFAYDEVGDLNHLFPKQKKPAAKPKAKPAAAMDQEALIRRIEQRKVARDQLAAQVMRHVGAFDTAGMDATDVAVYGCKRLGLEAPKGQEIAFMRGVMQARENRAAGMDARPDGWLAKQTHATFNR